jgi:hypothetical protein
MKKASCAATQCSTKNEEGWLRYSAAQQRKKQEEG